jgi:tripartite-type tricarboxylate transporter receptor subunit TctC
MQGRTRTTMRKQAMLIATIMVVTSIFSERVTAQDWPARPLMMVVPFAAGGPTDVLGRILAAQLSEVLGEPVVVKNVPGAGGMTGSNSVAQAAPDGYEFVLGSLGTHAMNQTLYKKPLYDAATDFAPVALISEVGLVLVTRKDLPPNNLQQFIAYAKENQAKMQYGSAGAGTTTHIGCAMLNRAIGVEVTHIPYRGGGPALLDLIAGRIDYMCSLASSAVPAIEGKTVKAIAMLTSTRSLALPDLQSAQEQGLKGFEVYNWNAVFLPRGTPPAIVKKLNEALIQAMDKPSFRERLKSINETVSAPEHRSPDYLKKLVAREIDKWAAPIKASGMTAD